MTGDPTDDGLDLLRAQPHDPDTHARVARRLLAAADGTGALGDDLLKACLRLLISSCPTEDPRDRPVLAHETAALVSSGAHESLDAVCRRWSPTVRALLDEPDNEAGRRHAVLLLLVMRPFWGGAFGAEEIRRHHLREFPRFTPGELALPYSVMFKETIFGANRDELLEAWWSEDAEEMSRRVRDLPADQVLFLVWLSERPAPRIGSWLTAYLRGLDDDQRDSRGARMLRAVATDDPGSAATTVDFAAWVRDLARTRQRLQSDQTPTRVTRVERSAYRYALGAANLAGQRLGRRTPLTRGRFRPRVAICVSGQLRGYEAAHHTWAERLLHGADVSVFVHSWTNIGRATAVPSRQVLPFEGVRFTAEYRRLAMSEGYEAMQHRLPTLFAQLDSATITDQARVRSVYRSEHVVLEDDDGPAFAALSNQDKMHYKIWAADQLAREHGQFDLYVRIRPDLEVVTSAFRWKDLVAACRAAPLLLAEQRMAVHYGDLMMGDQLAIAAPAVMEAYAGTWTSYPAMAAQSLAGVPAALTGHVSLAATCWTTGIRVGRAPLRLGRLRDPRALDLATIIDALRKDDAGDGWYERLHSAAGRDLADGR